MTTYNMTTDHKIATLAALANMDRRVNASDLANGDAYAVAMDYAKNYAGSFPFMVSMQLQVIQAGQWLTNNQAVAVLNCAVADYKYNAKKSAVAQAEKIVSQPVVQATEQVVPDGWYTIQGNTSHRTIRLQTVDDKGIKQWLAYLSGTDNEGDYTSIGFVEGNAVKLFRKNEGKYADIVAAARFLIKNGKKAPEYGKAYALRSGNCARCNRKLTVPLSITNGYGPTCSKMMGL